MDTGWKSFQQNKERFYSFCIVFLLCNVNVHLELRTMIENIAGCSGIKEMTGAVYSLSFLNMCVMMKSINEGIRLVPYFPCY